MPPATAGVVIVGDEILSGKFAEENAAFLIGALRELGVALRRIAVVPDVVDDIAEVVGDFARRFDHVFTSGGVGPTHDDLTIAGVARAFGVQVVRDPTLEQALRDFYGPSLVTRNLRMADVPEGAHFVPADHPRWPALAMKNVYILPGVPMLLRRKFDAMKERFRQPPFFVRRVFSWGEEGALAGLIDAVVAAHPEVSVGSYPRFDAEDHRVIVTFEAKGEAAAQAAAEAYAASLPEGLLVRVE